MSTHTDSGISYGFVRQLEKKSLDQAVDLVTAALKEEGFGILSRIDVQDTLEKKLGVNFRRYIILGACNPSLAYKALQVEPHIGLLLPCNVTVQESPDGEGVTVSIADPRTLGLIAANEELEPVIEEAERRLWRVTCLLG